METKIRGHNEERKQASHTPRGPRVKCRGPAAALFCVITCLIYFASQKRSAMTEPISSDPRVSVSRPKEGGNESAPAASNGISMNLRASGSGCADSPAIRAAVPLRPNTTSLRPVCYYRLTRRRRNAARLKGGGGEQKTEVTAPRTCVP